MRKIVVVGLGGIGTSLVYPLARFLASHQESWMLTLVDGDSYEPKNENRQVVPTKGNKAEVTAAALTAMFPKLAVDSRPWYIDEDNAFLVIEEDTIVFLCVDNHVTRKLVSAACEGVQNIVLISAGNDLLDGNVQVYVRKMGQDVTASLTAYHPEIKNAKGKHPAERRGCDVEAAANPQLLVTNMMAASFMFAAFYNIVAVKDSPKGPIGEIYFSVVDCTAVARERKPLAPE